jgi:hypothetical protein
MTSSAITNRFGRTLGGAVLSGGLAVTLTLGIGSAIAQADPTDSATQTDATAAQSQTIDQILGSIDAEYDTGAGGGQISNLIHSVLLLRQQGVKPSETNRQELANALKYRPNQVPLISALKTTLAYQQKTLALMTPPSSGGGYTVGINQYNPNNPGVLGGFGVSGPNGGIGVGGG